MKTLRLVLAHLLLLGVMLQAANQKITGTIIDETGTAIAGVAISVDGGGVIALSDDRGAFSLDLDLSGERRLTFKHIAFKTFMVAVNDFAPLRVRLEPALFQGQGVTVTADRAELGKSPVAFTDFTNREIERDYTIGEFPLLLETTPNVYAYADAGGGLGYSYLKIRGFDDKRVSVYINGIPLNDPEDQATYFVDLPDFASSVKDIQVQRGIGSSLYGDASFGGTVNIVSAGIEQPRQVALETGYGGFWSDGDRIGDMQKQSFEYRSGLIDGRWNFSGRYSRQLSDGYRKNSWYNGWAYHLSLARLDPRMSTTINVYGGPMQMHLAYYGVSRDQIRADRRFNPLTYENETDNFNQPHYELHNTIRLSEQATLTNTLFHIHGRGFYEQYRDNRSFFDYGIPPTRIDDNNGDSVGVITGGDLVRQQHVRKNQWGWNPRLEIARPKGSLTVGGQFYYFASEHWGQVVWAEGVSNSISPQHRYYEYTGRKWFGALYATQSYSATERLNFSGSLQLRYQHYDFDQIRMGAYSGYDYNLNWLFLSPRFGANYRISDRINLLAGYSLSSRVPADWEIYDAGDPDAFPALNISSIRRSGGDSSIVFGDPLAESERVHNFELGMNYRNSGSTHSVNLFWMDFENELVPYGGLNDLGLTITTNVDRSVHAGIELASTNQISDRFRLSGNYSLNYNRIKRFAISEAVYDNDTDWNYVENARFDYDGNTIAGFPNYIANLIGEYQNNRLHLTLRGRFVGKIYVENNNLDSLAIDPFFVGSMSAAFSLGSIANFGALELGLRLDNIFDKEYEASGYGGVSRFRDSQDQYWAEYIPAAGRSVFASLRLELQ